MNIKEKYWLKHFLDFKDQEMTVVSKITERKITQPDKELFHVFIFNGNQNAIKEKNAIWFKNSISIKNYLEQDLKGFSREQSVVVVEGQKYYRYFGLRFFKCVAEIQQDITSPEFFFFTKEELVEAKKIFLNQKFRFYHYFFKKRILKLFDRAEHYLETNIYAEKSSV